jgi:hypothetical protein
MKSMEMEFHGCLLHPCNTVPDSGPPDLALCTPSLLFIGYNNHIALDWFEPALTSDLPAPWLYDYAIFISELKSNLGPHDPEGEAKAELESLCMRDNQQITKYLVEFQQPAARVQWGDAALRRQLYNRLLSQIKDEIARVGKPNTLDKLRTLAQTIDACYWERRSEVARETSGGKTQEQ